jgi:protein subunit release factor A
MGVFVELRAGEGGQDAKLLVDEMVRAYAKLGVRRCL